ncbi:MAG: ABC transporter substrate-binding protein [Treponema sp.]|jgi:iron complex transport system substrate-binding protein|nr:ABC transporter substrate-binding protein [Treponema sp.]
MRKKNISPPEARTRALKAAGLPVMIPVTILAVLLLLGGCTQKAPSQAQPVTGRVVTDRSGIEVSLPSRPERVISTAPSNTEIVIALGKAEKLIAVDTYSGDLAGLSGGLPLLDFMYLDAEFILTLDPDLIIAAGHNRTGSGDDPFKLIREAGISVVYVPTSNSVQDIYEDVRFIAGVLGADEAGAGIINSMREEVEAIAARGASIGPKKTVYMEISPFPYMVSCGKETYLNEMIEIIGAENIFAGERGWFSPAAEAILERNPDVILTLVNAMEGEAASGPVDEIKSRSGFETIRAVQNNEVYALDADSASRPSPGILPALRQMARVVYPDWYAEKD